MGRSVLVAVVVDEPTPASGSSRRAGVSVTDDGPRLRPMGNRQGTVVIDITGEIDTAAVCRVR
jgi:hypothetical protein